MIIETAMVGSENGTRARAPATKGLFEKVSLRRTGRVRRGSIQRAWIDSRR
jgi:hypothetical protein